jgi:arylsulfatase A-like enzyme
MNRPGRVILLLAIAVSTLAARADEPAKRLNVLFIAVDDLNHWIGHLGRNPQAKTPNIDRLARAGVTFTRAYCAAPVCNGSRAALMSGLRPSSTGVYDNGQGWASVIPKEKTLTTQFLNAGYNVFGVGKIYHGKAHRTGEWTDYNERGKVRTAPHPESKQRCRWNPIQTADE